MSQHNKQLLPCPFCGQRPALVEVAGLWTVVCEPCGVELWLRESKVSVRTVWNRRVEVGAGAGMAQASGDVLSGPKTRSEEQNAACAAGGGKAAQKTAP